MQAWYEPAAYVVHLVGQSSGVTVNSAAKRLPAYWFDSRHRYFRKHYGYLGTLAADTAWLVGHMLMRARRFFTGVSHSAVANAETRDPSAMLPDNFCTSLAGDRMSTVSDIAPGLPGVNGSAGERCPFSLGAFREDYHAHGRDWTKPGFAPSRPIASASGA